MAKYLLISFLLLAAHVAALADDTPYKVTELRKLYLKASKDEATGARFQDMMRDYNEKDPVVLAYKAASEAVMAKYLWNPYQKLKQLKTAAALFEEAVRLDNDHPEIRFLRFTVEHYVPRYLNLSQNIEEDKAIIINSLKSYPIPGASAEWARTMRDFMLSKDHCTEEEKEVLRSINI